MVKNLDALKDKIDILAFFEALGLEMRRNGSVYSAICPIHPERTPSFTIYPHSASWYCFGCARGGDAFRFIQEFRGVDFKDALIEVARIFNFPLEFSAQAPQKPGYTTLARAVEIFAHALKKESVVLDYLAKRGLSSQLIEDYQLGFCNQEALDALRSEFGQEALLECGLLEGLFKWRIMFPLRDFARRVCGFSARLCAPRTPSLKDAPKYINSRQNAYFDKSKILWNLHRALGSIMLKKQAIITEGFLDVAGFEAFGYPNVVCCVGTAFSQAHLEHLASMNVEIVFSFDQDEAGQKANMRALEMCFKRAYSHVGVVRFKDTQIKDMGEALKSGVKPDLFKTHGWSYFSNTKLDSSQPPHLLDGNYYALLELIENYPPFLKHFCLSHLRAPNMEAIRQDTQERKRALVRATPALQASPLWLEGRILATMLISAEFRYTAKRFLSAQDFHLQDEFNALAREDLGRVGRLDVRFKPLEPSSWQESLLAFKIRRLHFSLQEALERGDTHHADALKAKLAQIQGG
ncbi:CHC2 zinc finger domain-containing protein [Helicobacter sp. L8]|uniref:CHC2 zinc finger domain-containing protein n=1 Tax=Helicobacter sp. L8 TaxID=2316078 RepID=UPI000EB0374C|nr:CHC2 zinc finger domain-containing protein [Helicobacter sp. L8]